MKQPSALDDAKLTACVDLIGRTGSKSFQIRYSDDEKPVVWIAVVEYDREVLQGYECAAALEPVNAAFRLCELLVDGGLCKHCSKPTGVTFDFALPLPMRDTVCWYQFDPELKKFRRSCEGD
jgi:hypothetical protein